MRETKHAPKGKRSKKALSVVLSVAGMSLAATAAGPVASMTLPATAPLQPVPLGEEEIADVSLATFHLLDQEKLGAPRTITELVHGGGGCGGCGGHGGGCGGCGGCHGGGFGGCHGGGFGGCHGGGFGGCRGFGFGRGCGGFGFGRGFGRGCRGCGWGGCGGWWGGCGWCLSWGGCNPWC